MENYAVVAVKDFINLNIIDKENLTYEQSLKIFHELSECGEYQCVTLWNDDCSEDRPITVFIKYRKERR